MQFLKDVFEYFYDLFTEFFIAVWFCFTAPLMGYEKGMDFWGWVTYLFFYVPLSMSVYWVIPGCFLYLVVGLVLGMFGIDVEM